MIDGRRTRAALWRHSGKGRAVPECRPTNKVRGQRQSGWERAGGRL